MKKNICNKKINLMKAGTLAAVMSAIVCLGTGCSIRDFNGQGGLLGEYGSNSNVSYSDNFFAMDTYMSITAYGNHAKEAVECGINEVKRLDKMLSAENDSSEIAAYNRNEWDKVSDEAMKLIDIAAQMKEATAGTFDIQIYPVVKAWGFIDGNYRVPSDEELEKLLSRDDEVTLGGMAKGYAADRVADILEQNEVKSAYVDLGGNIRLVGRKTDGSMWRIAIKNPDSEDTFLGVLKVENVSIVTSGGYERFFEQDGKTYHHIINPATGKPAESGLKSVTIVAEDGTLADMLSTSLFVRGREEAVEFWRNTDEPFEMVLYTDDGIVLVSEGLKDSFSSELTYDIIGYDE